MLERGYRRGNRPTLLVGMYNGAATMKNSLDVTYKVKQRLTTWSCIPTPGHISGETPIWKDACIIMFNGQDMEAMSMSTDRGMDLCVCVYIYIYILLSHKNDWKHATDTFATTCMDLEIIRLRGLSQRKTNITSYHLYDGGFPGGASSEEPTCWCRRHKRWGFDPWVGKIPWRRAWQPTAVFLPRESHGQRSLVGYGP